MGAVQHEHGFFRLEARSPITRTRMQKLSPDPTIETNPPSDGMDVGTYHLAQHRDLIDKTDLGSEKGIGGVFDQLCAFQAGLEDRCLNEIKGPVQIAQKGLGPLALHPDDYAIWAHKICDRCALPQKLRVGGHIKI